MTAPRERPRGAPIQRGRTGRPYVRSRQPVRLALEVGWSRSANLARERVRVHGEPTDHADTDRQWLVTAEVATGTPSWTPGTS
jgi:hypothetical protein